MRIVADERSPIESSAAKYESGREGIVEDRENESIHKVGYSRGCCSTYRYWNYLGTAGDQCAAGKLHDRAHSMNLSRWNCFFSWSGPSTGRKAEPAMHRNLRAAFVASGTRE